MSSTATAAGRILGVDAARALAVAGMMLVHVGPATVDVDTVGGWLYEVPHGRASLLFVLLAGVGVSLLSGRQRSERATRRDVLVRVAVFLPLGLALQALDTRVAVILHYYAVYYLVALALRRLRDPALLATTLAWTVLGPALHLALSLARPEWFAAAAPGLDEPVALVRALLLDGYYPVVVWGAPLAWGVWLGRRALRSATTRRRMVIGGSVVATLAYLTSWYVGAALGTTGDDTAGWLRFVIAEPHADTPLWLLGGVGVATAVLGACLVLAEAWRRSAWPLVATGQLALTVYAGHLLVLAAWEEALVGDGPGDAVVSAAALVLGAVVLSVWWRRRFPRGPLEWVVAGAARSVAARVRPADVDDLHSAGI